jgi:glycerol dehydrogenase-like iron-containing ADH family enzyme
VAGMGDALSTWFEAKPAMMPSHQHGRRTVHRGGAEPGAPVL